MDFEFPKLNKLKNTSGSSPCLLIENWHNQILIRKCHSFVYLISNLLLTPDASFPFPSNQGFIREARKSRLLPTPYYNTDLDTLLHYTNISRDSCCCYCCCTPFTTAL